jgi:hypothetical protein
VKYALWKYRSALVTMAMVGGALFFTSTVVSVLDLVMRNKASATVTETYVPPTANPTAPPTVTPAAPRPASTGGRNVFHAQRD